jgi:endonuclease YncB( thermonuclease family)
MAGHSLRRIALLCLVGLINTVQAGEGRGPGPISPRSPPGGHSIEGRIVGVHDGDTITLLDAEHHRHKIRLDGIDAPELGQPFGGASNKHLAGLPSNREAVAECGKTDRYGREARLWKLWKS